MITAVEKPHDLPSASWRPRRAGDAVQLESKGLKTKGWWFQSKHGRRLMSQLKELGGEWILPPAIFLFYLRPSIDWMKPTYIREGNLLYSIYSFKSHSETSVQTQPEKNV